MKIELSRIFKNELSRSRQVFVNGCANLLQLAVHIASTFWLTRFLLDQLGPSVYGMYPLVRTVVELILFLTAIVNLPAGRNLMIEHARDEVENANVIFNSYLFGLAGAVAIVAPCLIVVLIMIPHLFSVPAGIEGEVRLLFGAVSLYALLTILSTPFSLATFIRNRLELKNAGAILETVLFIATVALLMRGFDFGLPALSIGMFVRLSVRVSFDFFMFTKLLPSLRIDISFFRKESLYDILRQGVWILLSSVGYYLFTNTDLLIINRVFGSEKTGLYGAILIFPNTLMAMSGAVSAALNPMLVEEYARNGQEATVPKFLQFSRILAVLLALPFGIICGFLRPLLTFWLGSSFAVLAPVVLLLMIPQLANLSLTPLVTMRILRKKVMFAALVYICGGLIKTAVAIFVAYHAPRDGLLGVAACHAIFFVVIFNLVMPVYSARIVQKHPLYFLRSLVAPLACFAVAFIPSVAVTNLFHDTGIVMCGIYAVPICFLYAWVVWSGILNGEEKKFIMSRLRPLCGRRFSHRLTERIES